MISEGRIVGDGSWELHVYVTDLQVERVLRVKSDLHIGGVMLRLVEDLDIALDWSDHALWWPKKNIWLTHTRSTLDQYGVSATAELEFTPMHKTLRVQLPDLREMDFSVDFSVRSFNAVIQLCKQLGIRHGEEMSFCHPLFSEDLKYNYIERAQKKKNSRNGMAPLDTNTFVVNKTHNTSSSSLNRSTGSHGQPTTPNRTPIGLPSGSWPHNTSNGTGGPNTSIDSVDGPEDLSSFLADSPRHPSDEARRTLVRPKSLVEKARMNVGWLDSSLSLMEQGVREYDKLLLRFKFFSFYDLCPKYDAARINLIYEQAKWALLSEEIDCTEEEMLMFAALQLQVTLKVGQPQTEISISADDDIDRALNELQQTLEGNAIISSSSDITHVPELKGTLRLMKPKRFTLKGFKSYFFILKDLHLAYYKQENNTTDPMEVLGLRNCELTPDVALMQDKFGIKLEVPGAEGMTEYYLRCSDENQYAHWMAGLRLASKGKTLADGSYQMEVKSIQDFLAMQKPAIAPVLDPKSLDIRPEEFLSPQYVRKLRGKAVHRILEAHANMKDLPLVEAKLQFIRACQALPDYGIALFLVRYMGQKKEELLGVASNRIMRLDANTGYHIKTYRYNTVKAWNVNWEKRHMMIQFEDETQIFSCLTADCKVIHEFIGGYIFLSMRTKDANQTLNEELFHKLTCGRN